MKASELREMSIEEITRRISDLEEELFRLRLTAGRGAEANPASKRKARRDVARSKTILGERQRKGQA